MSRLNTLYLSSGQKVLCLFSYQVMLLLKHSVNNLVLNLFRWYNGYGISYCVSHLIRTGLSFYMILRFKSLKHLQRKHYIV